MISQISPNCRHFQYLRLDRFQKIQIGSAIPLDDELSMQVKGRDFVLGLPRTVEIKTNEIVRAISKELREKYKRRSFAGFLKHQSLGLAFFESLWSRDLN